MSVGAHIQCRRTHSVSVHSVSVHTFRCAEFGARASRVLAFTCIYLVSKRSILEEGIVGRNFVCSTPCLGGHVKAQHFPEEVASILAC